MKTLLRLYSLVALFGLLLVTGSAQETAKPTTPDTLTHNFRAEFLRQWDDFGNKMIALADAMPKDKYSWRPGVGVRSVGEVFAHVASGNFGFMKMIGVDLPSGIDRKSVDSLTDKEKIVEVLKKSFEHVRQAIVKTADADFDKPAQIFGREGTVREVFFLLATHQPEHLGQSIAYARMNGVVPPWTAERQVQQQPPVKK